MKKFFLMLAIVIMALTVTGCLATKSKRVTTYPDGVVVEEELTNEASFNELQRAAIEKHSELVKNPPVIATLTTPDGSKVDIHSQITPKYPVIRQRENPFVKSLDTVINSTPLAIVAGGWSAERIIQSSTGDISASDNASVTTTSNSHNASELRNADGDITEDHSNNSVADSNNATDYSDHSDNSDNSDHSDNSDNSTIDSHDQTAEPTVVTP